MGGKNLKAGNYIFLCTAFIIIFFLHSCASLKDFESRRFARSSLVRSQELAAENNFDGAVKENEKVLSLFVKGPPGDEALFNLALIYAHSENPDKNYGISATYLRQLVREYPLSPLKEQAGAWLALIEECSNRENGRMDAMARGPLAGNLISDGSFQRALKENKAVLSEQDNAFRDRALFSMALIYSHFNNPDRDYKKAIYYLSKLVMEHPDSSLHEEAKVWLDVLNIIEQAKQVDIEIEQKKKELAR